MDDKRKGAGSEGAIDSDIQSRLGERLKEVYSDVINEPVPDRFLSLLDQLSKAEKADDDDG